MEKIERDLWRATLGQWRTPRTFLGNVRFLLAMKLGGFRQASR